MYYINSEKGGKYGVFDTKDKVTEYYTKQEILSFGLDIEGVTDNDVFVMHSVRETEVHLHSGDYENGLRYMPTFAKFEIVFRTKPIGELNIVSKEHFTLVKNWDGTYGIMKNKSYISDLSYSDIIAKLQWYFENMKVDTVKGVLR